MFRNQYDSSTTTWSPQGRIHQIEYAMEAVKQGSATVGVKSKTHAVLVALKVTQLFTILITRVHPSAHKMSCLPISKSVFVLPHIVECLWLVFNENKEPPSILF